MAKISCKFVSNWDDGFQIESDAIYDDETGEVEVLTVHDIKNLNILNHEYISLPDGEDIPVCRYCHSYITKEVMIDYDGTNLVAVSQCVDKDCAELNY